MQLKVLGSKEVVHRTHVLLLDVVIVNAVGLSHLKLHVTASCLQTLLAHGFAVSVVIFIVVARRLVG